MKLNALTIAEARDALRKGDVTSVELTEACLTAIDSADALNAFVHKTPELALERARAADVVGRTRPCSAEFGRDVRLRELPREDDVRTLSASRTSGSSATRMRRAEALLVVGRAADCEPPRDSLRSSASSSESDASLSDAPPREARGTVGAGPAASSRRRRCSWPSAAARATLSSSSSSSSRTGLGDDARLPERP